jgi:PleD family two-component response regulator
VSSTTEDARPRAKISSADTRAIRVLIVDDDVVDRMAVRRALQRSGVNVTIDEATGAVAALSTVPRNDYECVFPRLPPRRR